MAHNKAQRFSYDYISSKDDTDAFPVCLTWAERQILLSMVDYIGWQTRWEYSEGEAPLDVIEAWRDRIAYKLMGECAVDCSDVWACLGISGTPPASIEAWLELQLETNSDVINTVVNPPLGTVASPVASDNIITGCDQDNTFAFALQLVQFINACITDAFEILEAITNVTEFARQVLANAPALTIAADFVDYMEETLCDNYLAQYTQSVENDLACAVYCMIMQRDSCTVAWEDLYAYFLYRFGAGVENIDLADLLEFIGGGTWSGTQFVDAAFALFTGVMFYGNEWWGITLEGVQRFWNSWVNDENGDWETLCSSCGWLLEQLLDSGHTETYWAATFGTVESDRVSSIPIPSLGYRGLVVNVTLPSDRRINMVKIYYRKTSGSPDNEGVFSIFDDSDTMIDQFAFGMIDSGATGWDIYTHYFDTDVDIHRVKFEGKVNKSDPYGGGYCAVNQIDISGGGSDPFP